jgi:hypothetical protein
VDSIEFAQVQQKVFTELRQGANVLKALQQEMTIDAVEDMMSDTREAIEHQQEIDRMLSESLTPEDDEAVMRELEALTAELPENVVAPPAPAKPVAAVATAPAKPVAVAAPPPPAAAASVAVPANYEDQLDELEALEGEFVLPDAPTHRVSIPTQPAAAKKLAAARPAVAEAGM